MTIQDDMNQYNRERAVEFGIRMVENDREKRLARQRALGYVTCVNMYIAPTNGENKSLRMYRKPFIVVNQSSTNPMGVRVA